MESRWDVPTYENPARHHQLQAEKDDAANDSTATTSHKHGLTSREYKPAEIGQWVVNGVQGHPSPLEVGAMIERLQGDYLLQPVGHIAHPFFRASHGVLDWPSESDVKITDRLVFGGASRVLQANDVTVGLELEFCFVVRDGTDLTRAPAPSSWKYLETHAEFLVQQLEVGTDPRLGGVYTSPSTGLKIHHTANRYIASMVQQDGGTPYLGGSVPVGVLSSEDVTTQNEYLRRISLWLARRANLECKGITDSSLREAIMAFTPDDLQHEVFCHDYTGLYGAMTFQPMLCMPAPADGNLLVDYVNCLNGGLIACLSTLLGNSPFWRGRFTGYEQYRQQLRLIYKTGLRTPQLLHWHAGGRAQAMRHLQSGEGINLGRAIVADDSVCYSNSSFRIRPDLGGVEVAYLDSYPLAGRRMAIAELHKALLLVVSGYRSANMKLPSDVFIELDDNEFYALSAQAARLGVDAEIDLEQHGQLRVRQQLGKLLDWLTAEVASAHLYSASDWRRYVLDWLEPLIEVPSVIALHDAVTKYFDPSDDVCMHMTAGRAQVLRYHELRSDGASDIEAVARVVKEYCSAFKDGYSGIDSPATKTFC